jgi:hypothetical protein
MSCRRSCFVTSQPSKHLGFQQHNTTVNNEKCYAPEANKPICGCLLVAHRLQVMMHPLAKRRGTLSVARIYQTSLPYHRT